MCGACIQKVTPVLNETVGDNNWSVDIKDPAKILTISNENADVAEVVKALDGVNYKAEEI